MTEETFNMTAIAKENSTQSGPTMDVFPINYAEKHIAELIHEIRRRVFVIEQHIDPMIEFDTFENVSQHYLAYYKNKAAGTARWRETDEGIKLERFCVLKEFRNSGIGSMLVNRLISDVKPIGRKIYLHAQTTTVRFYEKAGFKVVSDLFYEADIPHFKMELIE
jgi:predicted GNAT family N-acyltransferase